MPELMVAIRVIITALGGAGVTKGWYDEDTLIALAGALATILATVWGIWAKRPGSSEAQTVSNRVQEKDMS